MAKALVLTAISGSQIGKRHTLTGRVNTIGSDPKNDLVLRERAIEPRHIEIRQVLERWFVVPLVNDGSAAALNGVPIQSQSRLNAGDALMLGGVAYKVSFEDIAEREVGSGQANNSGVPRLGEYLVRRGIMTQDQVDRAVKRQQELSQNGTRVPFGKVAHDMGFINRTQLDTAIADQRGDFNARFLD